MKIILAIAAIFGVWALATTIAWAIVAKGTEEVCVCTYYDDIDMDCEDCD